MISSRFIVCRENNIFTLAQFICKFVAYTLQKSQQWRTQKGCMSVHFVQITSCRVYVNITPPSITEEVEKVNREWLESQPVVPLRSLICVCCLSLSPTPAETQRDHLSWAWNNLKLSLRMYVTQHFAAVIFFFTQTKKSSRPQTPRGNFLNYVNSIFIYAAPIFKHLSFLLKSISVDTQEKF